VTELCAPGQRVDASEQTPRLGDPVETTELTNASHLLADADDREFLSRATCLRRVARKTAVTAVGASVVVLGVVLILLPVPGAAILVIPLGLAILATEFAWARKLVDRLRKLLERLKVAAARVIRRPSS